MASTCIAVFGPQLHRRTLAERTVNLRERSFQRLLTIHVFVFAFLNQLQLSRHVRLHA
jgi:hypothetical protein